MKKKFLIWIGWLQFTSNSILAQSPKRYSLSPPHTLNTHTPNTRSYPHTSTHMHTHSTPHPRSPHTHTRRETCAHAHTQGFHSLLAVANPEPRVMPLLGNQDSIPHVVVESLLVTALEKHYIKTLGNSNVFILLTSVLSFSTLGEILNYGSFK